MSGASRKTERTRPLFVLGRSLIVCTTLAGGFAGMVLALGGTIDGVQHAQAATPAFPAMALPKPKLALAPTLSPSVEREDVVEATLGSGLLDRVPPDFLVPDLSAPGSDPDQILEFGPVKIRRHLVETIVKAAKATSADPVLLMAIADKESSFSTHVKARTSSATGLFQFIDKTWIKVVRDFGAKYGLEKEAKAVAIVDDEFTIADPAEKARILELRREPYISALLAAEMLKRDGARISRRIGRDLSHGETYLAHFLGPDDAERFLAAVVEEPKTSAAKLLPKPARANKSIFFVRSGRKAKSLSVAEVHQKFEAMMSPRLNRYRNVPQVASADALAETSVR